MKKVGFLGGTFDPIHFGHINLAISLAEACNLSEVLFCPTFCSPFKRTTPPMASIRQRIAMVKAAIQEISGFSCYEIEEGNVSVSYTIDVIHALKRQLPQDVTLYLLLSQDALADFHLWKSAEEIIRLAEPLVGSRAGYDRIIFDSPIQSNLEKSLISTRTIEISSTEIRERLKKNLYCGHLVPHQVLKYIQKNHLYT